MKKISIILIIFWVIIILAPAILAYLIWWLFIFIWINILIFFKNIKSKTNKEEYIKFGKYKIYK